MVVMAVVMVVRIKIINSQFKHRGLKLLRIKGDDKMNKIICEKLEDEIQRIKKEYMDDEDLSIDYIEGLIDGIDNSIRIVKTLI